MLAAYGRRGRAGHPHRREEQTKRPAAFLGCCANEKRRAACCPPTRFAPDRMLSLLASATSAAARPAHALQPTPPSRSCLSTAVDIKTVEWCHAAPSNRVAVLPCAHPCCRRVRSNLDCNTEGVTCPAACVCSETGSSSADLALSMPSSDFMRLSDFVGTLEIPSDFVGPLDDGPQVPATSLVRRFQANNMTAPATDDASDPVAALKRLPSDAVGFCALHTDTDTDTDVLGLEWQSLAGWPTASWLEHCPPILRCACAHNRSGGAHAPHVCTAWQT